MTYPTDLPARIDQLLDDLARFPDPSQQKLAVAALVMEAIDAHRLTMLATQKVHFVNAVGSLCLKGAQGERLTINDLRVSLADLRKAVTVDPDTTLAMPGRPISDLVSMEILLHTAASCVDRFGGKAARSQLADGPLRARSMIRKNASSSAVDAA